MANYRNTPLGLLLAQTKALSDPARVRALAALRGGELCACQLIELLGLAPSTVSKHMAILREAGLVVCRKEGRWCHFSRADEPAARAAMAWLDAALEADPALAADRHALAGLCSGPPPASACSTC